MERFWLAVLGRLSAQERSQAWLARQLGMSRQRLSTYVRGDCKTPDHIRDRVALVLDLRNEEEAA
jgi:DNA-binding CsgD family transcriptional regulator